MVLLGVVRDNVVDFLHAFKLAHQIIAQLEIRCIDDRGGFGALYEVCIVACAFRQGDERIKKPPLPMDGSYELYPRFNFSCYHGLALLFEKKPRSIPTTPCLVKL